MKFNQSALDLLRQPVIDAGDLGIYAALQLFEAFSVEYKAYPSINHRSLWPGDREALCGPHQPVWSNQKQGTRAQLRACLARQDPRRTAFLPPAHLHRQIFLRSRTNLQSVRESSGRYPSGRVRSLVTRWQVWYLTLLLSGH